MYRHLRGVDCGNGGGDCDQATRGLGGNPGLAPALAEGLGEVGVTPSGGAYWAASNMGRGLEAQQRAAAAQVASCWGSPRTLGAAVGPTTRIPPPGPATQATPPPAAGRRTC